MRTIIPILASLILFCSSSPVRVACVGECDGTCPGELQAMLGTGFEVRSCSSEEAKAWLPDIVAVLPGTDITDAAEFERHYLALIDGFRGLASKPSIYLCTPPPAQGELDSAIVTEIIPAVGKLSSRRWLEIPDIHSHPDDIAGEIYRQLYRNGETTPGKRVLFIGDSITDGDWAKADGKPCISRNEYDGNHYLGHGYVADVAIHYLDKYPQRHYKFCNRGISGNKLEDLQARWETDVLAARPDVVSILIGVNDSRIIKDTGYVFDYAAWEARYRDIIERTLAVNPDTRFVLCTPFIEPVFYGGVNALLPMRLECVRKLGEIVRRLAGDYDAVLVPFDTCMDSLFQKDRDNDVRRWTWDGVHPTYAAHARMAKLWRKRAGRLLK